MAPAPLEEREALMLTTFGLLSLLVGSAGGAALQPAALPYRPHVEIWTDRGDDPYSSGQGVRVHFRAEQDAYVTILRIDTDGRVRVLFPREPSGYGDWDYDLAPYYVQRHYDNPRFLCYDCHSYVNYSSWSPYDYTCVRFRIVVFDDPYYYPYRSYDATRVVFTRPLRPEPRFIFKDRQASDAFVTRVRARPADDNQRREVGVRGRDLGGTGVIPPPGVKPRTRPITGDQSDGDGDRAEPRPRERPRRPDPPAQPEPRARPPQPDRGDPSERPERR